LTLILYGNYAAANRQLDEVVVLADEKGTAFWKAYAMNSQGWISILAGEASDAVRGITVASAAYRSTASTIWTPWWLSCLAVAYAKLGQFVEARRSIGEAVTEMETAKETLWEAEINRIAGEIALQSPTPDTAKAEAYFERALTVSHQQQAKSWELRAAMSLARHWRDQGKAQQARELLAPIYGWFTEGFDTRDLKEAKALLEELAA
jgi:predicted ATPase